jgi:RecB family exonuclease
VAEVEAVAYGREATEALRAAIAAAQADDRLAPVTVIVPSNLAGLSARRTLAEASGLANVAFDTPFGLAERLGRAAAAGAGLTPITEPVLVAAIRVELRRHAGFFGPVAEHAATESALARRYAELSRARPETRARIRLGGTPRARELVELFERVRTRLEGYADEDALVAHALGVVEALGPAVDALGSVVVHLPQPLPPALHDLVAAVVAARPTAWVVGGTGDASADAPVFETCRRWGVTVVGGPGGVRTGTEMISASDVDEEVRAVTRRVLALAREGARLDRVAILMPAVEPYARTVDAALSAAGLAHNGPPVRRLADTIAGRTLARLVRMVDSAFARDDVMAFLASAPVRWNGNRPVPVDRWDLISRRAGVVDGDDWVDRLGRYASEMAERDRDRARSDAEAEAEPASPRAGSVAHATQELAAFVAELRTRLAALAAAVGWRDRVERARAALSEVLGDGGASRRWPAGEQEALQSVLEALDRLAALEAVEAGPAPGAFGRAIDAELAAPCGRVGRFGDGVLCAPVTAAVGLDLDAVFVVGMAEGLLPVARREDALLADADRRLAVDGALRLRGAGGAEQRRAYLAALAAARGPRVLSAPRGDLRSGRERLPSRFLLETATARAGQRIFGSDFAGLTADEALVTVPSFAAGIRAFDDAANPAERELGVLEAFVRAGGDALHHALVAGTVRATGIEATRARGSDAVTRWDGNVGAVQHLVPSPATGDAVSPTRLQAWAECPFRYFLGNVLRVRAEDTPERLLELSALERGTLVHEVLERFVREELERPPAERTPAGEPWPAAASTRIIEIMDACAADAEARGLTGKATLWALHREDIAADLVTFVREDSKRRVCESVVPESVELPFGLDGAASVSVPLGDGRAVAFRGRADRVDVRPDGTRVVLDYKTGRSKGTPKEGEDPLVAGARLQLPVYAEAARQLLGAETVEAAYWFVSARGQFVYDPLALDAETEVRFGEVVGEIVDGIDHGRFPAVPGEASTFFGSSAHCRYCDFDRVCPVDRDAQWEGKVHAPEFANYQALQPKGDDA